MKAKKIGTSNSTHFSINSVLKTKLNVISKKKKDDEFRKSLLAAVSGKNNQNEDDEDNETPSGDEFSARGGAK